MNKQAFSARKDVEGILLIVDASVPFGSGDEYVIESIKTKTVPVFLVLNKIDLLPKSKLLPLIEELNGLKIFTDTFLISAKTGEQVDELKKFLIQKNFLEKIISINKMQIRIIKNHNKTIKKEYFIKSPG